MVEEELEQMIRRQRVWRGEQLPSERINGLHVGRPVRAKR